MIGRDSTQVVLLLVAGSVEFEASRTTLGTGVVVIYGVVSLIAGRRVRPSLDCQSRAFFTFADGSRWSGPPKLQPTRVD